MSPRLASSVRSLTSHQRLIGALFLSLPGIFTGAAFLLVPWIAFLVVELPGHALRRSLAISWIGLDLVELGALLLVASLLRRGHRATSPVAAVAATLLTLDAWFDLTSAAPRLEYALAIFLACAAELPLAALLAWVAHRTLVDPAARSGRLSSETPGER